MSATSSAQSSHPGRSVSVASLEPIGKRPVQWKRLWQQLAILQESDPRSVLDAAFSVGDALGGMSEERLARRLVAEPRIRSLMEQGVSLVEALADHEALAAMPDGSLGRAFLHFSERHGLDPRKLVESQHDMSRDYAELDPARQWIRDRLTVSHDLWHVVAGYDATPAGESALMCFSLPQRINDRALPIFITMATATGRISPRNAWEAFGRGRRAVFLPAIPFEQLLPLALANARARLGVSAPGYGHPRVTSYAMLIPH